MRTLPPGCCWVFHGFRGSGFRVYQLLGPTLNHSGLGVWGLILNTVAEIISRIIALDLHNYGIRYLKPRIDVYGASQSGFCIVGLVVQGGDLCHLRP